jgi:hypothetical protein
MKTQILGSSAKPVGLVYRKAVGLVYRVRRGRPCAASAERADAHSHSMVDGGFELMS